jgi:predicted ArsR family transcriptional regulator
MKDKKEEARKRSQLLKRIREEHKETVERTQALLKDQKDIRRQLTKVLQDGPKTIPEIAAAIDLPTHEVLWHVTAMKKYDLAAEAGMSGEYFLYQLVEER